MNNELIHVGYAEEREDLFLLALPATKASAEEVSQVVRDTVRVLRLSHRTLAHAFAPKNEGDLHQFFSVLFLDLLLGLDKGQGGLLDVSAVLSPNPARFQEHLPAVQLLHLPADLKFQVDDALTQLESADFQEFSPDFYDSPREFNILGTCLFHKGFLVASHLSPDDLVDVVIWCQFHQILPLTRMHAVHQIVTWSEVFPSRVNSPFGEQPGARTFLLVVGLGFQVLAVVLESGPGTPPAPDIVRPDPFYVDQALSTLDSLLDMGVPTVCNKWLRLPANPAILNLDELLEAAAHQKRLDGSTLAAAAREQAGAGIILKKTRSYDYASTDSPSGSLEESVSLNQSQVR